MNYREFLQRLGVNVKRHDIMFPESTKPRESQLSTWWVTLFFSNEKPRSSLNLLWTNSLVHWAWCLVIESSECQGGDSSIFNWKFFLFIFVPFIIKIKFIKTWRQNQSDRPRLQSRAFNTKDKYIWAGFVHTCFRAHKRSHFAHTVQVFFKKSITSMERGLTPVQGTCVS